MALSRDRHFSPPPMVAPLLPSPVEFRIHSQVSRRVMAPSLLSDGRWPLSIDKWPELDTTWLRYSARSAWSDLWQRHVRRGWRRRDHSYIAKWFGLDAAAQRNCLSAI